MMFIKLTFHNNKRPLFVDPFEIMSMVPDLTTGTHIVMKARQLTYHVAQTPEQVIAAIEIMELAYELN